jgi:hypothetical protein
MSSQSLHDSRQPCVYDYSSAIAKAVEWLGDRYLLAKPMNATHHSPARICSRRASHSRALRRQHSTNQTLAQLS